MPALIAELRAAFAGLAREDPVPLRAVVLAGDGPSFCSGADLAWMRAAASLSVEANEQDAMAMADLLEAIDTCPAPIVARVHGAALGGGMGLSAVSDLVIAESGTRFGFTETRVGILPAVIAPFVIAKIGESHARALFPGGRRSTPSAPSGSGSCTRSWRATRPSMPPWTPPSTTCSPRDRQRRGPPRRSSARSRARARIVEVAHSASHRSPARHRGGPRGLRRLRRTSTARLGARPRALMAATVARLRSPATRALREAGPPN